MAMNEENDNIIYKVVVNHEEQYSIWPDARQNPLGWNGRQQGRYQGRMSGIHQDSMDGHAPAELEKEDGTGL